MTAAALQSLEAPVPGPLVIGSRRHTPEIILGAWRAGKSHRSRDAFSAPRFKALYRMWRQDGEAAFAACRSHVLDEAVAAGSGRVETLELGHRYGHLSPRSPWPDV